MKPITLGKNIEDIFSRVLVTRDEIERLKDAIKGLASSNIEIINQVLDEISNTEAIIEAEYRKFLTSWKKLISEYNAFMDESEWDKTIEPELKKTFVAKMDSFLQQFLTLVKVCEDFFIELLDKKWSESYTVFDLNANPYFYDRQDLSEKSKKVRLSFTLPDSLGYNWYSSKISDEYLQVKKALLMIHKFGETPNSSKLDVYLKGKTITEFLMFHPKYGTVNYVGSGRNKDMSGLVDYETNAPFIQIQVKNIDSFAGQINELKNYHFSKDLAYKKFNHENKDIIEPEYFAIMRHVFEPGYEQIEGEDYFIVKIKDNAPLHSLTPKHYQISRYTTDAEQLLEEFKYTIKNDGETTEKRFLTIDLNTSSIKENPIGPNDNSPANYLGIIKENISSSRIDKNNSIIEHFIIPNIDSVLLNNNAEYININGNEINRIIHYMYINAEGEYNSSNLILSNSLINFNNNILFYKRKGFGKKRNDYELFKNWVLKILPNDYTPIGKSFIPITRVNKDLKEIRVNNIGILKSDNPVQLIKENIFDSILVNNLKSYYFKNDVDIKISYEDYIKKIIMLFSDTIENRIKTGYNFLEYFDLFDNPNRFNTYFFTPYVNVEAEDTPEENKQYFVQIKGNYETSYSENISKKSNKFPKIINFIKKPEWNDSYVNGRYSDDHIDDKNGLSWYVTAANAEKATTHAIIYCIKYTENDRKLYTLEYQLTDGELEFYRSCFITGRGEFACISFKDKKVTIFKFNEETKAVEFIKRITLPITLLTAKDTSNSKTNWMACCHTNEITYNSFDDKLYGFGTNSEGEIYLYKINPDSFIVEENIKIPTKKDEIEIDSGVYSGSTIYGTENSVDKQIAYFSNKQVILYLQHNPYNGLIYLTVCQTPELGFDTDTLSSTQPLYTMLVFNIKTKKFFMSDLGGIHLAPSSFKEFSKKRIDILKFYFNEKETDYCGKFMYPYNNSNNVNNVIYVIYQNLQSDDNRWFSLNLLKKDVSDAKIDACHNNVFMIKDGYFFFAFDRTGTGLDYSSPLYGIGLNDDIQNKTFSNEKNLCIPEEEFIDGFNMNMSSMFGIYSRKYNKVYMASGIFEFLEEGIISEDNIKLNHSARTLLNHTALTETDESDIFDAFYKEIDEELKEYSKLTIGTIKAIPYNINNPEFLNSYAKAGTFLSKEEYPDAYLLFGDIYAEQYEEEIEEGYFALPNLNDRYITVTNNSEKVNKISEDQFADLGYTLKFEEKDVTVDDDYREGFISEVKEPTTAISLATGTSGGTDRKKIRVNHNSNASITSGADFRLDYYIKVK